MATTCKFKLFVDNVSDAIVKLNEVDRNQIEVPEGTVVKWIVSREGYQSDMGEVKLDSNVAITVHLARNGARVKNTYTKLYKEDGRYVAENTDLTTGTKVITSISIQDKVDDIDKEFDKVCYFGDLSNINYINYDISVDETE